MPETEDQKHPSFGVVGINRISCSPPMNLFDSQTKHSHLMCLKIAQAKRCHNDGTHDTFVTSDKTIIEVLMSEAQFAHFVSSPNMGSGTPCTISRLSNESVEGCPEDATAKEYAEESVKDCEEVLQRMTKAQEFIDTLVDKKSPLNKAEKAQLADVFGSVRQQIELNVPFLVQSLQETMDGVVEKAKSEIEIHCMKSMNAAGLIGEANPVTMIGHDEESGE